MPDDHGRKAWRGTARTEGVAWTFEQAALPAARSEHEADAGDEGGDGHGGGEEVLSPQCPCVLFKDPYIVRPV